MLAQPELIDVSFAVPRYLPVRPILLQLSKTAASFPKPSLRPGVSPPAIGMVFAIVLDRFGGYSWPNDISPVAP